MGVLRCVLGVVLGLVARVHLATLRVRLVEDPALSQIRDAQSPWVLVFWHGEQFALLAWPRRRKTFTLGSWSSEGPIQAQALARLGLGVERGSTSRGGARGLAAMVRRLRAGHDAAFAVDGPRGPRFSVSPGAALAADKCGGVLVPIGASAKRAWVLDRAWDHFRVPYPFSEVTIRLGAPIAPHAATEEVAAAIHAATTEDERGALRFSPGGAPC